jgi:membrane peptidoglycan carboxypeptidase
MGRFSQFRYYKYLASERLPSYQYGPLTNLEKAIVLLEDRRFFQHSGVDLQSIARELSRAITFRRFGGASTLDMQLVRVRTGDYERSVSRKFREVRLSLWLQKRLNKLEILRTYTAIMYLGYKLTGISAACQAEFGKSPSELTDEQAARIAAFMVYPRPKKISDRWRKRVERRTRYGVQLLATLGAQYDNVHLMFARSPEDVRDVEGDEWV